jgi:DNA-binding transcriptional LysR family regulator
MNIDQIKTVLELNKNRHFKKTAQTLFVTQSTISARLNALEQELGCKLFIRTSRTIEITPAGERFLDHAHSLLSIWRRARQEAQANTSNQFQLATGGLFVTWDIFLQSWLERLHQDYPTLALTAESHDHTYLLRQLLDGALDLIFITGPPRLAELCYTKVMDLQLTLVSDQPGRTLKEAVQTNYILVDWGEQFLLEHTQVLSHLALPQKRVNQARISLNFILNSGGAAFLPSQMIAPYLDNESLFEVKGVSNIPLQIYAAYMKNSSNIEFVEKALKYL